MRSVYIENLQTPSYISIIHSKSQNKMMISLVNFEPFALIYSIKALKVSQMQKVFVNYDDGLTELISNKKHTINRGNHRLFTYFDMFMNHCCDPNTILQWTSDDSFDMIAKTNIQSGEELTVDYRTFDILNDDEPFQCTCKVCSKTNQVTWI